MTALLRRARPGVPPEQSAAFHAPLFRELVTGLEPGQRRVVLDLGAASTPMLAFLGRARCRVEVADIAHFGGIDRLNAASPGRELAGVAESLFPNRLSNEALDLVFLWDIANYLTLDALTALMNAIQARARPGACVHALIYYADRNMPQHPARFVPTEAADLIDLEPAGASVPAPRYSPEHLAGSMRYFAIDRARLLSNGLQEFLFELGT